MFTKIILPLDGSRLAEAALPVAESLAQAFHAGVALLHLIEEKAPESVHSERHLTQPAEAEAYLDEVVKSMPQELKVEGHVHTTKIKDVPASVVEHVDEFGADLVVMCAHGRSGIRDLLFGRIAQKIMAQSGTPLLFLQPTTSERKDFHPRNILLPLDSESIHDDSLPFAEALARAYHSDLHLLSVVPTYSTLHGEEAITSSMLPATTSAILDAKELAARTHLQEHLKQLQESHIHADIKVARGDPTETIVNEAERVQADLIILSTHRHAGLKAFWERSVSPNVARRTRRPILLIPL